MRSLPTNTQPRCLEQIQTIWTAITTTSRTSINNGRLDSPAIRIVEPDSLTAIRFPVRHVDVERHHERAGVLDMVLLVGATAGTCAVSVEVRVGVVGGGIEADAVVALAQGSGFDES